MRRWARLDRGSVASPLKRCWRHVGNCDYLEDWYLTGEEAEATLEAIVRDEPDFEGELWVGAVDFEAHPN